jgi:hypothetical protein
MKKKKKIVERLIRRKEYMMTRTVVGQDQCSSYNRRVVKGNVSSERYSVERYRPARKHP